jgi:hypothetical protein
MPSPVSLMFKFMRPSVHRTALLMRPPSGVDLMALPSILQMAFLRALAVAEHRHHLRVGLSASVSPLASAAGVIISLAPRPAFTHSIDISHRSRARRSRFNREIRLTPAGAPQGGAALRCRCGETTRRPAFRFAPMGGLVADGHVRRSDYASPDRQTWRRSDRGALNIRRVLWPVVAPKQRRLPSRSIRSSVQSGSRPDRARRGFAS